MKELEYRIDERLYGPAIVFNDWRMESGSKERGGGAILFGGERFEAVRDDYPHGGGGDVSLEFRFRIEIPSTPMVVFHVNRQPLDSERGFRVEFDERELRVVYRGEVVGTALHAGTGRDVAHELALVTIDRGYEVRYAGAAVAGGDMRPPYLDNEGWVRMSGSGCSLRLLEFAEHAVVDPEPFPPLLRGELLDREEFDPAAFEKRWVVNTASDASAPIVEPGRFVFRNMSNAVLRQRFDGPIIVDFLARPIPTGSFSAGVTDAIFLWMAEAADSVGGSFPDVLEQATIDGVADLKRLLPHRFYWVDFGGTNNVTTRLRKNPYRRLMRQYTDRARLLETGRTYRISTVAHCERIEFHVDGEPCIRVRDREPHTAGHVGVRAFVADLELTGLEVYRSLG